MYISRILARKSFSDTELEKVLLGHGGSDIAGQHHVIWQAFGDGMNSARRSFLYRDNGKGEFLTISKEEPHDTPLLMVEQVREFRPDLREGDRFRFFMRVNAARKVEGKYLDVVMEAMKKIPEKERARQRQAVASREIGSWLEKQGRMHGFSLNDFRLEGYRFIRVAKKRFSTRTKGKLPVMSMGLSDIRGALTVTDVEAFREKLFSGFGRTKSYGNGMMMIRRTS